MKKFIALFIILIILVITGIYFFIPATLTVSSVAMFRCSEAGVNRTLQQKETWKKFWQGNSRLTSVPSFTSNDWFLYNRDTFRVTQLLQGALSITVSGSESTVKTTLLIIPVAQDSIGLQWSYTTATSANPIVRVQQYRQAVQTKDNLKAVLNTIKQFLSRSENIYGITITQISTNDTFLISTTKTIKAYPATDNIYGLISKLQAYATANNAAQTGDAMMNITELDKGEYKIMVAIPTDKLLNEQGDITYKRMVPGRFLTTTVTGGNGTITTAYNQLQQYFEDYHRTSMAIPFQYLVTNRSKEKDTSKWVTKLYFPVM